MYLVITVIVKIIPPFYQYHNPSVIGITNSPFKCTCPLPTPHPTNGALWLSNLGLIYWFQFSNVKGTSGLTMGHSFDSLCLVLKPRRWCPIYREPSTMFEAFSAEAKKTLCNLIHYCLPLRWSHTCACKESLWKEIRVLTPLAITPAFRGGWGV